MDISPIITFLRAVVMPTADGDFAATVRTVFQNDDGTTSHVDNYSWGFAFQNAVNADQIGISNHLGNILINKTRMGLFDVEFAGPEQTIERCYACGWLYFESTDYRDQRLGRRPYDPTDYDCGCTIEALEAEAEILMDLEAVGDEFAF